MAAIRLIFISNFRLLVQKFCHILTSFSSSAPQHNFPLSMYTNSASLGFFIGTSGLRRLFNCCCVCLYLYFNWYKYGCILPSSLSILLFQIGANFFNKKASKANITRVTNIYVRCTVCYHSVHELIQ